MPITPLEGITYVNQNMQVAASKQLDFANRVELQNYAALIAANEKEREIEETRETEESAMLDPDREHNRERSDEEAGEKEAEMRRPHTKIEEDKEEPSPYHLLDIKA